MLLPRVSAVRCLADVGAFLHCFCRHCGTPLWVECDGILDGAPLTHKFRELVSNGVTTIGINMRAATDISQELLERIHVERSPSYDCILESTSTRQILGNVQDAT